MNGSQENKGLEAFTAVAVAIVAIFGLSFLAKQGFEEADRFERGPRLR
jgi:hypothetical protein